MISVTSLGDRWAMSLRALSAAVGLLACIWTMGGQARAEQTVDVAPGTLFIGPVSGLTTDWHLAPPATGINKGIRATFKVAAPPQATVLWTGAQEVARDDQWSTAVCLLTQLGLMPITATVTIDQQQPYESQCSLKVMNVPIAAVSAELLTATTGGLDIDPNLPPQQLNELTVAAWFGPSVATVQQVAEGAYLTSVDRPVSFSVVAVPPEFTPLMEWRVEGAPVSIGGEAVILPHQPGTQVIEAGPPAASQEVKLKTYSVQIVSPVAGTYLAEGEPITFVAQTDPPGYEGEITWLSATKFGAAQPVLGQGPVFTAQFDDTLGLHPDGSHWQWMGVKADNAVFGQDVKSEEIFGNDFAFNLDPTQLEVTTIEVTDTNAPGGPPDPFELSSQIGFVPPLMDIVLTLSYIGPGGPQMVSAPVTVDNGSGQMFNENGPIDTVSDIFGPVNAVQPDGTLAVFTPQYSLQILLLGPAVGAAVKDLQYHTDQGAKNAHKVKMQMNGGLGPFKYDDPGVGVFDELVWLKTKFTQATILVLKAARKGGDGTQCGDTTDTYNCHGLTFANGGSWITDAEVQNILTGNGYTEQPAGGAKVGDVCVFKDAGGGIIHTETVTMIDDPDGNGLGPPTKSMGKWGSAGEYTHDVGTHPYTGADIKYWHSDRVGGNKLLKAELAE